MSPDVLLAGVALNLYGSVRLTLPVATNARGGTEGCLALLGPLALYQLFSAGTAAVFASLYLYLWLFPEQMQPFLIFGAALKTWAAVLAGVLRWHGCIAPVLAAEFGIGNGLVALMFWALIAQG